MPAFSMNVAHVQQFNGNVLRLAQQETSRLIGAVRRETLVGKYGHFDRLASTAAELITSVHADTPVIEQTHSRRRVILNDYVHSSLIDDVDKLRMIVDPSSIYVRNAAAAMGRVLDDIIIDAADGSATSVDSSDSSSTVAITHTVDEDFNTSNSDIIMEKVVEAKRILMSNEVDPSEELFFVLDSKALHNLLKETEVSSADYNTVRALSNGMINTFMGFRFIQSERINNSTVTSETLFKNCLAFSREGLLCAMGKELTTRVDERADKNFSTQVYTRLSAGSVRMDESRVVVVEAYRT